MASDASTIECRLADPEDLAAWDSARAESRQRCFANAGALLRSLHRNLTPLRVIECWQGGRIVGGCFGWARGDGGLRRFQTPVTIGHGSLWVRDASLAPSPAQSLARDVTQSLVPHLARDFDVIDFFVDPHFPDIRGFSQAGWTVSPYQTYQMALADADSHWRGLERNLRNHVSSAKKKGLTAEPSDDVAALETVLSDMAQRRGLPPVNIRPHLDEVYREFRSAGHGQLFVARRPTGEIGAAALILWEGREAGVYMSAVSGEHGRDGANPLVHWAAIEWLAQRGAFDMLDLYGTEPEEVGRFKKQFNAPLAWGWQVHRTANPGMQLRRSLRETWFNLKQTVRGRHG